MLKVKRVYEGKEAGDGKRILVDRLWPRGLRSEQAAVDEWMKDVAPSDELRKWFAHDPEKWAEFQRRYAQELAAPEKAALLKRIAKLAAGGNVTLVYAAKDTEHNNARVLEEFIAKSAKGGN
jgi:uncharacterized protein YeaO (DUF488 family)